MKLEGVALELVTKISTQSIKQNFFTEAGRLNLLSEAGFEKPGHLYNSIMLDGWAFPKK